MTQIPPESCDHMMWFITAIADHGADVPLGVVLFVHFLLLWLSVDYSTDLVAVNWPPKVGNFYYCGATQPIVAFRGHPHWITVLTILITADDFYCVLAVCCAYSIGSQYVMGLSGAPLSTRT